MRLTGRCYGTYSISRSAPRRRRQWRLPRHGRSICWILGFLHIQVCHSRPLTWSTVRIKRVGSELSYTPPCFVARPECDGGRSARPVRAPGTDQDVCEVLRVSRPQGNDAVPGRHRRRLLEGSRRHALRYLQRGHHRDRNGSVKDDRRATSRYCRCQETIPRTTTRSPRGGENLGGRPMKSNLAHRHYPSMVRSFLTGATMLGVAV